MPSCCKHVVRLVALPDILAAQLGNLLLQALSGSCLRQARALGWYRIASYFHGKLILQFHQNVAKLTDVITSWCLYA